MVRCFEQAAGPRGNERRERTSITGLLVQVANRPRRMLRLVRLVKLAGEPTGQKPADNGGGWAADHDGNEAKGLAVDHQIHTDAEHGTANQAAGDAGGDAEPENVAAGDHGW